MKHLVLTLLVAFHVIVLITPGKGAELGATMKPDKSGYLKIAVPF